MRRLFTPVVPALVVLTVLALPARAQGRVTVTPFVGSVHSAALFDEATRRQYDATTVEASRRLAIEDALVTGLRLGLRLGRGWATSVEASFGSTVVDLRSQGRVTGNLLTGAVGDTVREPGTLRHFALGLARELTLVPDRVTLDLGGMASLRRYDQAVRQFQCPTFPNFFLRCIPGHAWAGRYDVRGLAGTGAVRYHATPRIAMEARAMLMTGRPHVERTSACVTDANDTTPCAIPAGSFPGRLFSLGVAVRP